MADSLAEMVDVKKILPDENQPRKYFAADLMYTLKQSIKKHGIKVPITVEDMGGGKYLLIDGERRFRAALELGLKQVPAIIEAPKSEVERLIEQFSIQEQHAAWTPIEKAMALLSLSKVMSKTLVEVCKMLDIDHRSAGRYVAFAELADKESFVKNEVPIDYALHVRVLKNSARNITEKVLEEEFTRQDEKKLEHQLTKMILRGDVKKRGDVVKLGDSFKKDPKLIEKFLTKDNVTPASLFLEAKAQGTHHLRNAYHMARLLATHIDAYMRIKDVQIDLQQLEAFTRAQRSLKNIVDFAD